jgi:tetratricopeptide (TPR) repeat protein
MDMHGFLRRACVVTLAAAAAGSTACLKEDADRVPPGSATTATTASITGAMAGAMAGANGQREPVITAESQALLELGNAAFRRKDYAAALAAYEKAAKGSPEHAAPWMGVYMVARVRSDAKAMDAAQAELNKRSPDATTKAQSVK